MRKITSTVVGAFNRKEKKSSGNTVTDGSVLLLHGNRIAEWRDGKLYVSNAGWKSNTTKERLNGIVGVSVNQKNHQWYLNGKPWNGDMVCVSDWDSRQPVLVA